MNTPRVYVGTYAKYNAGNIKGAWLDLEDYSDKEDFLAACAELHDDEADPEFMFQDYEHIPEGYISESGIDYTLWADYLSLDEDEREILNAARNVLDSEITWDQARDAYQGQADSEQDFAEQFIDDCGVLSELPESLRYYFDYEKYARDLFMGDFIRDDESGHIFNRNY